MNIIRKYLTPNKYARPEIKLDSIQKIVVHWISQPSTALNNIKYYSGIATRYGGFQAIIDHDGTIYEAMPYDEKTYGCGTLDYNNYTVLGKYLKDTYGSPNNVTFNIELCHPDLTGKPTDKTYEALLEYLVYLCTEFELDPFLDVVLHSDIVSQNVKPACHRWFVNNPSEWLKARRLVSMKMISNKEEKSWEQADGEKAIDSLVQNGLINSPEYWKTKDLKNESTPLWLYLVMSERIVNKINES